MQTEREQRKVRLASGEVEDDDEFSDEERDKCTDFKRFRRFSQDFTAKQHQFNRLASLHHAQSSKKVKPNLNRRPSIESPRTKPEPEAISTRMRRRHSIAAW